MLWLLESAQRMLGMGRREMVQTDTRWLRDGNTHSKFFQDYLPPQNKTYSCVHCQAHLAYHNDIISKVSTFPSSFLNYLVYSCTLFLAMGSFLCKYVPILHIQCMIVLMSAQVF